MKFLILPALLMMAACNGVGEPSAGIHATYDQSTSRAAFDRVGQRHPDCFNHNHHDKCDVQTDVKNHVSPLRGAYARVNAPQK